MDRKLSFKAFCFLSPWLLGLLLFLLAPILASLILAFTNFDGINEPLFAGLNNFQRLIKDPLFYTSLQVTFTYAFIALPLGTIFAIGLAILLNTGVKGLSFYRSAMYLPTVVPLVASSVTWTWIFKNSFIEHSWLADARLALPALIIMSFWSLGNPIIIYLSGLQNIPEALYEAAELDGANSIAKFIHITLPVLSPSIFFNVVIGIIQVFQYFVPAYMMTSGGPQGATMFYSLYTYQVAFDDFEMGYASALAWVLFLIVAICTAIAFGVGKRHVSY